MNAYKTPSLISQYNTQNMCEWCIYDVGPNKWWEIREWCNSTFGVSGWYYNGGVFGFAQPGWSTVFLLKWA
jgi:hypothetical protein